MSIKNTASLVGFLLTLLASTATWALAEPGKPAPSFSTKDASGKTHTLDNHKGKWLVLEWFNQGCPYVKKHYGSDNMQGLQRKYTEKGVTWLTVISSAKGKQGHVTPESADAVAKAHQLAASAPFLLDPKGLMGKAYGAKTTPHMYIINPQGTLVYAGAIDDNSSANPAVIPQSTNYVAQALDQALAGKKVEIAATQPYGCSVKY